MNPLKNATFKNSKNWLYEVHLIQNANGIISPEFKPIFEKCFYCFLDMIIPNHNQRTFALNLLGTGGDTTFSEDGCAKAFQSMIQHRSMTFL